MKIIFTEGNHISLLLVGDLRGKEVERKVVVVVEEEVVIMVILVVVV
jgi:hypothetical protein